MRYRYAKFIATRYLQSAGERNVRHTKEASVNWKSAIKYATALFIAQFLLGFFEGLLFEPSVSVAFSFHTASFVICGAIFLHLGMHQSYKPFVHAWAVFILEVVAAWVVILLLYRWFGSPNFIDILFECIVGVFALVAGTSFGILLHQKTNPKEKA